VVACQAAGGGDVSSYRTAYVDVNRTLLDWAGEAGARSYVYTSSTGVFGYDDGRDVDEETAVAPSVESAAVLVEAEELVRGRAESAGGRVVRLSGLYGPDRLGIVDRVRRGALGLGPGDDTWMNFCHRDDAVAFVLAALFRGRPGAVYHGSDAAPARRYDVVSWIARRLGTAPGRAGQDGGRMPGGRRGANRRVLSEKTRTELAVELRYPSFREGLDGAL
jgi:nucleoside-diphosphate-sugar epimerase